MLNLLDGVDLKALGHNSPAYLHRLIETIKLAFADRDAYYGDPHFVKIPADALLSKAYAAARQRLIKERAWPDMPPAGDPDRLDAVRHKEAALPLAGGSHPAPGGAVQQQAMLQVFLNATVFGMDPQLAIEAPRVASRSHPDSFWPHAFAPGKVEAERRIPKETREALAALGHTVADWPEWEWRGTARGGGAAVRGRSP